MEKRIRKEKKRKEREQIDEKERERLALEANERAGAKLEAAERARVGHQQAQAQAAAAKMARKAASPAPERVKKERHSCELGSGMRENMKERWNADAFSSLLCSSLSFFPLPQLIDTLTNCVVLVNVSCLPA